MKKDADKDFEKATSPHTEMRDEHGMLTRQGAVFEAIMHYCERNAIPSMIGLQGIAKAGEALAEGDSGHRALYRGKALIRDLQAAMSATGGTA